MWVDNVLEHVCNQLREECYIHLKQWMGEYKKSVLLIKVQLTWTGEEGRTLFQRMKMMSGIKLCDMMEYWMTLDESVLIMQMVGVIKGVIYVNDEFSETIGQQRGKYGLKDTQQHSFNYFEGLFFHKAHIMEPKEVQIYNKRVAKFRKINQLSSGAK